MSIEFENLGFIKEYYIENKFIGYINYENNENRAVGYVGKNTEKINEIVVLHNGKKIKQGVIVTTIIYPKNGKIK
jgi:hypothetical protein